MHCWLGMSAVSPPVSDGLVEWDFPGAASPPLFSTDSTKITQTMSPDDPSQGHCASQSTAKSDAAHVAPTTAATSHRSSGRRRFRQSPKISGGIAKSRLRVGRSSMTFSLADHPGGGGSNSR